MCNRHRLVFLGQYGEGRWGWQEVCLHSIVPSGHGNFARRLTGMCSLLEKVAWFPRSRLRSLVSCERAEINTAGA